MLSSNRVQSGATVSLKGWVKPVAEPEIAVWFGSDLTDSDPQTVKAAIKGIGAAIELADMEFPPQDVVKILDGNIYHRHVILGPCDESRAGANLDGISSRVSRHGVAVDSPADLESNTGRILDVVCHVAATLAACGETISAGDVLICGSITPPIFLEANDTLLEHALDPCGTVSVNLSFT
jgi:2-keto-4-pentenoate hydratase